MNLNNFFKKKINNSYYIIAEIGVNHEGSLERAKKLILSAKNGGADCVKFQTYKAEKLASKNSPSYWDLSKEKTDSQFKLFKKYDGFNKSDYIELYKFCKKSNICFLSTPFDLESVDELDNMLEFYKISSSDITNTPLIDKIISKRKPIIISTGASSLEEIDEIYKKFIKTKLPFCLMHCVLSYPTKNNDANLKFIKKMSNRYPKSIIGYSDHTLPDKNMSVLTTAHILGAKIIEKHFTDNKKLIGNDHYHSMDHNDLVTLNKQLNYINNLLGSDNFRDILDCEITSRENARRSLYYAKDLKKGDIIDIYNVVAKRPSGNLSPSHLFDLVGKKLSKNVKEDELVNLSDIKI